MRITVCQTAPVLLGLDANCESVIENIRKAAEQKSDLVIFPELALTGYFVGPRYHEAVLRMDSQRIARICEATRGTAAVVGFIEESPSMNFYNSALVAVDGRLRFAARKLNLPNYGVFEERKFFSPGKRVRVFRIHDFVAAVFICNDLWHPSLPYLGVCQKADIIICVMNSSVGSMGSEFSNIETWDVISTFYSRVFGIYTVCANRAGDESDHALSAFRGAFPEMPSSHAEAHYQECSRPFRFWGGSKVVNPFGTTIAEAPFYEEGEVTTRISRELLRRKRILLPYLSATTTLTSPTASFRVSSMGRESLPTDEFISSGKEAGRPGRRGCPTPP
ncbi:MAG: nitrilase-related carbon-nitrogen hydrolase [Thermodesulfobacteriota bacterium]